MRSLRLVSALIISGLSTAAFAQSSTPTVDQMRQPGGLFDATPHTRPNQVAGWGLLDWNGIGVGARYILPIVADGFIPELNDSFEVEAGANLRFINSCWGVGSCGGMGVDILGEARWTFHIWPSFSAYAKLSLGPTIVLGGLTGGAGVNLYWNTTSGAIYKLNDKMDIRAEFGWAGIHVGLGYAL